MLELSKYLTEATHTSAMLGGMALQYLFGQKRGFRILMLIIIATVFVAVFVLAPIMDYVKLDHESPIRTIVFALSSLVSVELVSMFIKLLPTALKQRFLKFLEVTDDSEAR